MTAFQKAEALAGQRYDRDKLLSVVHEVTTHFHMPNSFERSRMRAVCRYLADALDRCSGSTQQHRWNDFEKRFWPKWKAWRRWSRQGVSDLGVRVLISAQMIAPSLDMLSDLRANQWIAHLPEDHPAWATEPDSPFKRFAPRTIPATRHTFLGYGFEKARERTRMEH